MKLHELLVIVRRMSAPQAELRVWMHCPDIQAHDVHAVLIGPECQFAQTLQATIPVRITESKDHVHQATVYVPDPCFWEPEHPFLYRLQVRLADHDESTYFLGIRTPGVRDHQVELNGAPLRIVGQSRSAIDATAYQAEGYNTVLGASDPVFAHKAAFDGIAIFHELADRWEQAEQEVLGLRNNPSVLCWAFARKLEGAELTTWMQQVRKIDPSRLTASWCPPDIDLPNHLLLVDDLSLETSDSTRPRILVTEQFQLTQEDPRLETLAGYVVTQSQNR